jgi:hypothetical protein
MNARVPGGTVVTMQSVVAALIVSVAVLIPSSVAAQNSAVPSSAALQQSNVPQGGQNAASDVEAAARRFGFGVRAGVGLDPELIDFGAHATFGPIFRSNVAFRPGIEFGVGEVTTMFGINLDVLYTLPSGNGQTRWTPYFGGGPNFALSHRGFDVDDDDDNDDVDTPNRFDFSDTDFTGGFNFIVGARSRNGTFFEMNATAYGVSNIRLLAGFNF